MQNSFKGYEIKNELNISEDYEDSHIANVGHFGNVANVANYVGGSIKSHPYKEEVEDDDDEDGDDQDDEDEFDLDDINGWENVGDNNNNDNYDDDDDEDIDIENQDTGSEAVRRAHHNALERKRRDHLKDSFLQLRNAIPLMVKERVVSRAQIIDQAAGYITFQQKLEHAQKNCLAEMAKIIAEADQELLELEKMDDEEEEDDDDDDEEEEEEEEEDDDDADADCDVDDDDDEIQIQIQDAPDVDEDSDDMEEIPSEQTAANVPWISYQRKGI